jgi:hypothetical protein
VGHAKVSRSGRIATVAGDGRAGYGGDGGPPRRAELNKPHSVAALSAGGFLIADTENHRIRMVRRGRIATLAGTGRPGYGGDGGPTTKAQFDEPKAVEPTAGGGFLVADAGNQRVRMVSMVGPRAGSVPLPADVWPGLYRAATACAHGRRPARAGHGARARARAGSAWRRFRGHDP